MKINNINRLMSCKASLFTLLTSIILSSFYNIALFNYVIENTDAFSWSGSFILLSVCIIVFTFEAYPI